MLRIVNLSKSYQGVHILNDISLTVSEGEILCLLGSSGCGKTTLLRTIAGLETPDKGQIFLSDTNITKFPVHQRKLGLMFQDFALFPHMNVVDNIEFGLRMTKLEQNKRKIRLQEVMELVQLTGYEHRDISQLSGGEKQRVALARSLAPNPKMLMLDEPLGSLDASLRKQLGLDLRRIIKGLSLTAIYVTHDQQEAFTIADRVAVMNKGKIEQVDSPIQLYQQPKSRFIASFLGLKNILPIEGYKQGKAITELGVFPLHAEADYLLIHPRSISIGSELNDLYSVCVEGIVTECLFWGAVSEIHLTYSKGRTLIFTLPFEQAPKIASKIQIVIDSTQIVGL